MFSCLKTDPWQAANKGRRKILNKLSTSGGNLVCFDNRPTRKRSLVLTPTLNKHSGCDHFGLPGLTLNVVRESSTPYMCGWEVSDFPYI